MTRLTNPAANAMGVMKKLLCASAIGLLAGSAQAAVIDFEGAFGPATHYQYVQQSGYDVVFFTTASGAVPGEDLVGSFIDGASGQSCDGGACPVNNPTTYYAALNDSVVDISRSNGQTFNVKSFDASFIGGDSTLENYPALAGLLRVQGFFANGTSLFETYQFTRPSPTSDFSFAHYNTSAAFGSQRFVEVAIFGFACSAVGTCSAFSTDRGQFGIDNINLTEIPEPASFALFGLGMAGVAFSRRRKSSKSL